MHIVILPAPLEHPCRTRDEHLSIVKKLRMQMEPGTKRQTGVVMGINGRNGGRWLHLHHRRRVIVALPTNRARKRQFRKKARSANLQMLGLVRVVIPGEGAMSGRKRKRRGVPTRRPPGHPIKASRKKQTDGTRMVGALQMATHGRTQRQQWTSQLVGVHGIIQKRGRPRERKRRK